MQIFVLLVDFANFRLLITRKLIFDILYCYVVVKVLCCREANAALRRQHGYIIIYALNLSTIFSKKF